MRVLTLLVVGIFLLAPKYGVAGNVPSRNEVLLKFERPRIISRKIAGVSTGSVKKISNRPIKIGVDGRKKD